MPIYYTMYYNYGTENSNIKIHHIIIGGGMNDDQQSIKSR